MEVKHPYHELNIHLDSYPDQVTCRFKVVLWLW